MHPYNLELLTYLASSKVCDGVGVFALVDIAKDTCIFKANKIYKVLWSEVDPEIKSRLKTLTYCDDEKLKHPTILCTKSPKFGIATP